MLAPGIIPIDDRHFLWRSVNGGLGFRKASQAFFPFEFANWPHFTDQSKVERERPIAIEDALKRLAARATPKLTLHEAVEQLAFSILGQGNPLVIDGVALREEELRRDTVLYVTAAPKPEDFLELFHRVGLDIVSRRDAVVISSQKQARAWQGGVSSQDTIVLDQSIREAINHGHDKSGRFLAAPDWLRPLEENRGATDRPLGMMLSSTIGSDQWTEWEPLAGFADEEMTIIVRGLPDALGFVAAGCLLLIVRLAGSRSKGDRARVLCIFLALCGLCFIWLPNTWRPVVLWPFLTVSAVLLYLLFSLTGVSRGMTASRVAVTFVILALGSCGFGVASDLFSIPPVTVYLIPHSGAENEGDAVLVPADFIARLKAHTDPLIKKDPVLTAATFDGKVVGSYAEFKVIFEAYCPVDEPKILAIPLKGVVLDGDVWLDGTRVHPVALPDLGGGFGLTLQELGRHSIEMHFKVIVSDGENSHDLKFTVPALVRSKLQISLPADATSVELPIRQGALTIRMAKDSVRAYADLGRLTTPLTIRWFSENKASQVPKIDYEEAYFWDLRSEGSNLTAAWLIHVRHGFANTFTANIPPSLEVRSARAGLGSTNRLKDWHMSAVGEQRVLHLDFQSPVTDDCPVFVELVPRNPLESRTQLALPTLEGHPLHPFGYLAYRVQGMEAQIMRSDQAVRLDSTSFAPFWKENRPSLATEPSSYAWRLGRINNRLQSPTVRLRLRGGTVDVNQVVHYRVGMQQVDFSLQTRLESSDNELAVVEWDIPSKQPLIITSVSTEDTDSNGSVAPVRRWSKTGNRIVAWLEGAKRSTIVRINGYVDQPPGQSGELPNPRVRFARNQRTIVSISSEPGVYALVRNARNLTQMPEPPTLTPGLPDLATSYWSTSEPNYGVTIDAKSRLVNASARLLTLLETRDRQFFFTTYVNLNVKRGELGRLVIDLGSWPGEANARTDANAQIVERLSGPQGRRWTFEGQPVVPKNLSIVLHGHMPIENVTPGMRVPKVRIEHLNDSQQLLCILGPGLVADGGDGLEVLHSPNAALLPWLDREPRLRDVKSPIWQVAAPSWNLRIRPNDRSTLSSSVRVYLSEQGAQVADGERWLHEASFWIGHHGGPGLSLQLPASGQVVSLAMDGHEVVPIQSAPDRVWMPLPGQAGIRRVHLTWFYQQAEENIRHPLLKPVAIEGVKSERSIGMCDIPPGWTPDVRGSSGISTTPAAAIAQDLERASAQLEISKDLAENGGPPLMDAQKTLRLFLPPR